MKILFGLGNPGTNYSNTRHNLGFLAIDFLSRNWEKPYFNNQHYSLIAKVNHQQETLLLVKPLTFMNLSGKAVKSLIDYFKIEKKNILVITDDINLEFGHLRIREEGSHGGHNGLKSIQGLIGSNYPRLRFGVGKSDVIPLDQYVLSNFNPSEKKQLPFFLNDIQDCVMDFVMDVNFDKIKSQYNGNLSAKKVDKKNE